MAVDNAHEIEFLIKEDGTIEYTIKGVKGAACEDISSFFADLGQVESERKTPEYYESQKQGVKITGKDHK